MLSGEAANINFIVFGLIPPGLKPTIYCTLEWAKHANNNTTDAVLICQWLMVIYNAYKPTIDLLVVYGYS